MDESSLTIDDLLTFGSLSPAFPPGLREKNVSDLERRVLAWVGEEFEQVARLADYKKEDARLQAAAEATQAILDPFNERSEALDSDFSLRHEAVLIAQRQQGLLAEAQLQVYEGTLKPADLQRLKQALGEVAEQDPDTVCLDLCIENADSPIALGGVLIVTTEPAAKTPSRKEPALLFVPGLGGGLEKFESLQALKDRVRLTLRSGLETPLWRHVPALSREQAMLGEVQLFTRFITMSPLAYGIYSQFKWLDLDVHHAQAGERFFADAQSLPETLSRLHREVADSMAVPINEVRGQVADRLAEQQRTAELASKLPAWLSSASLEVRNEYVRQLGEFRRAAVSLEVYLGQVLPSFEGFVARQLSARIQRDLKLEIDADKLIIDLPKRVFEVINNKPQFGSTWHSWSWEASPERVQQSLPALACYNFAADDKDMAASLSFAGISYPPQPQLAGLDLITGDYLYRLIPKLDLAQHYGTLLRTVFHSRSTEDGADNELKLKPYELEIQLNGFLARHRRLLSEAAYALLVQVAQARSTAELSRAGVQMHWVVFRPGESVSGERSSRTLQGLCVIYDQAKAKVLVYLPQVPDGNCLIEADSLEEARDRLISSLIQTDSRIAWLVSRVDEPGDASADARYVNEALRRGFAGFIAFVPALDLLMTEQQLNSREWLLQQQLRAQSRSNRELAHERDLRRSQVQLMYLRALLSFIPGLGALFSVQDGWNDGHASVDAFRQGKVDHGLLMAGSTLLSVVDVLLSVLPGLGTTAALARVARKASRLRQAARPLAVVPSVSRKHYVIKPFAGYDTDVSLVGAVPLSGRGAGVWLKDGEMFIYRQDKAYRVYRRPGEETLRLRKTMAHGYEPPVRRVNGQWVYHTDVGLKAGVRSWIAEDIITKANATPGFTRKNARTLLNEFDFPADSQRRLELDVAEYYRQHKTTPQWVERYRRPTANRPQAPLAAPAGPSRPLPGPSPAAPGADSWKQWRLSLPELTVMDQVSVHPPVYKLAGENGLELIRIDQSYFEILPMGSAPYGEWVLLRNGKVPFSNFDELNSVIQRNVHDQPVIARFDAAQSQWRVQGRLFERKIEDLIEVLRPGFTDISRRILAEKLYDLSQPLTRGLNPTRLHIMRATLDAWRRGGQAPLANLNDPLLMLDGARPTLHGPSNAMRWNLSYESALQPFQRLDFTVRDPLLVESLIKLNVGTSVAAVQHLRALMARALTSNGYEVLSNELVWRQLAFTVFRRPGRDEIYLLNLRHARRSYVRVADGEMIGQQWNANAWFDVLTRHYAVNPAFPVIATLQQAKANGRLVTLLGGINLTSSASGGTQVFVMRLAEQAVG